MGKKITLFILLGLLALCLAQKIETTQDILVWAFLHYILHGFFFYRNFDKIKTQYAPYSLFISGFNLFTYGITPFFVGKDEFQFGTLDPEALQVTFYAFLIFYIVLDYLESNKKLLKKVPKDSQTTQTNFSLREIKFIKRLQLVFCILYLASQNISLPISGLDNILAFYTCGLFLVGFYTGINNTVKDIFLIFMVVYESFKAVSSGLIFPLIFFSIFLLVIGLNTYKRSVKNTVITYAFAVIVGLFSILFSSVREQYRMQVSWEMDDTQKAGLMQDLIFEDNEEISQERLIKDTKSGPLWRMSYPVSAMSMILEETPRNVPFWDGESYYPLLYKFIPRFLWPEKPAENMGQLFGHTYKLIGDDNLTTSMNTPILVEAYMNFSYIGLFILIFLMAIATGKIFWKDNIKSSSRYAGSNLSDVMKILKVGTLAVFYCQWESNLSMMMGKVIILYFVDLFLRKIFIGKAPTAAR